MTDESDDRLTQLYNQMEKVSPSEMLDARIKKAAHENIRKSKHNFVVRWVSVAAVIVLSVGVVLRVVQERPVEQDLLNNLDEMHKTESDAAFEPESSAMDMAPDNESMTKEKRLEQSLQRAPALPSSKVQKSREVIGTISSEAKKQEFSGVLPSELRMEKPVSPVMDWCGQNDLADIKDIQLWIDRIDLLKQENRLDKVQCLQLLMRERFLPDQQ